MKSARLLLPHLSNDDKNPSTILDIGCFTQEARKYLPSSVRYIGVDSHQYHSTTKVMNLSHGFEPIPASHALCLETLEHLVDPSDTLESLEKSLAENGHLVVSLPNEATVFHRIRCLFGTVDAQAFASEGKHLHLPNLKQSRRFLSKKFDILSEQYYISPSACGSGCEWLGRILTLIPDWFHQLIADRWPSLFARGFIFLLKKRT